MRNIFQSVSQVVFLLIAVVSSIAFVYSVYVGTAMFETKDFMLLAGMTFGYFFGAKPTDMGAGVMVK